LNGSKANAHSKRDRDPQRGLSGMDFKMKTTVVITLLAIFGTAGCAHQTRYRVTLVSDQPWVIGEAKPCYFDEDYMQMHCFPPTPEALAAPKHDYLVDADFAQPVKFDAQHWAGGNSYPYDIVCRLDSYNHATCLNHDSPAKK
jgi:hypothetical protein